MSHRIDKNNPKRWFLVQDNGAGEESIKVFGYAGEQGVSELVTGQPNLNVFLTEDTLEAIVDSTTGITDYYKDAVESGSDLFQGPSGKYQPPPPPVL
jgi:hypothetical protein